MKKWTQPLAYFFQLPVIPLPFVEASRHLVEEYWRQATLGDTFGEKLTRRENWILQTPAQILWL